MIDQALILAGGLGTRLGDLAKDRPKPVLDVGGRPFLEYLIWNLARHGVRRIVLATGHRRDVVRDLLGDGSQWGVQLEYSEEETPLGTGGAVKNAASLLGDAFFVLNGDTVLDLNYLDLALRLELAGFLTRDSAATPEGSRVCQPLDMPDPALAAMALRRVEDVGRYGRAVMECGLITGFSEKGGSGPGLVNAGVYVLRREALDLLPDGASSLEEDLFPVLASRGKLAGAPYEGFFLDIGLPETLRAAGDSLPEWKRRPAVFFDRDGVLNVNYGYVHRPGDFEWMPGACEAVKWCNDHGYLVVVITNQSGIARGFFTEERFLGFMKWVNEELRRIGAHIDAVYHCPHHPSEGGGPLTCDCECRKPAPGMILRAINEMEIRPEGSFMVGDSPKDVEAAHRSGIPGFLYEGDDLATFVRRCANNVRES